MACNDYTTASAELRRRLSIPSASQLALEGAFAFAVRCISKGQRYGLWLEAEEAAEGRRAALRSANLRHHLLKQLPTRHQRTRLLYPWILRQLWNSLVPLLHPIYLVMKEDGKIKELPSKLASVRRLLHELLPQIDTSTLALFHLNQSDFVP